MFARTESASLKDQKGCAVRVDDVQIEKYCRCYSLRTTVFPYVWAKIIIFALFLGQYQLDLLLNAEEYEYCELTNQRVGVLIIIHEANSSPFLWPTHVMASPGMHTHVEIHSSRVSTSANLHK